VAAGLVGELRQAQQQDIQAVPVGFPEVCDLLRHVLDIDGLPILGLQCRGLRLRPGLKVGVILTHGWVYSHRDVSRDRLLLGLHDPSYIPVVFDQTILTQSK
jgi:hypothetical protein